MGNISKDSAKIESIIFPPSDLKIIRENNIPKVFDILRKKYVCLTEEEFVRQSCVNWMKKELAYPASLMANEIGIKLNDTIKRCDTVVFDPSGRPQMILEYKAPSVNITQKVFDQIVRYNMALKARFLVVTNGLRLYCCKINPDNLSYIFLSSIPCYQDFQSETL